mgnify:FL=1
MKTEEYLYAYYQNGAKKLCRVVDRILARFGGVSDMDRDDFYSAANEVMANICRTYDNVQNFDGYVYSCLSNKIKTEMTKRNREKRKSDRQAVSIDTPLGEDEATLQDLLVSDFDIEKEVFGEEAAEGGRLEAYLSRLSDLQRGIVELLAAGYKAGEIQRKLQITGRKYHDCMQAIQSYENVRILM